MDNVVLKRITYEELLNNSYNQEGDDKGILSKYLTESVRQTLLANPNIDNDTKTALNLVCYNNVIAGRHMLMPTKLKLKNKIVTAQSGGSHEVVDTLRGKGLGSLVVKDSIENSDYPFYIGQLYSTTALSILKKLDLTIFEIPQYYKLINSRPIWQSKGINGFPLQLLSCISNFLLKITEIGSSFKYYLIKRKYTIKKEKTIPKWVNDVTTQDGHDFMEIHDSKWIQWNVDYKFTDNTKDKQEFYAVYDHHNKPKGFVMIKIRFENKQGIYSNITRGTIVEWGSIDEENLDEVDLNLIAVKILNTQVDTIITVSSNPRSDKGLKHLGFLRHGSFHMAIKTDQNDCPEIHDKHNWRIRFGGSNTIIF